jgi:hypothetical protein
MNTAQKLVSLIWLAGSALIAFLHYPFDGYEGVYGPPPLSRMPSGTEMWRTGVPGCEDTTLAHWQTRDAKREELWAESRKLLSGATKVPQRVNDISAELSRINDLYKLCHYWTQPTIKEELQPLRDWKSKNSIIEVFRPVLTTFFAIGTLSMVSLVALLILRPTRRPSEA